MISLLKNWKLLLGAGAVVCAFLAAWQIQNWRYEAAQKEAIQRALIKQAADYEDILGEIQDARLKEQQESRRYQQRLAKRNEEVKALKEAISDAEYQPQGDGACPRHPINDPQWLRDRIRAAELPGKAEADNPR